MAKNKISDLRDHLFATLEALRDEDKPLEIDRARAIADISRVIVDSAKVEVDFVRVTGAVRSTDFLPSGEEALKDRKGGDPTEWPEDLRVREYPEVRR